jgi:GDP-D-mannose 3',5'-epimerase
MVSINQLAQMVMDIAGKTLSLHHIAGPQGVRGRCSHNLLVRKTLGWTPKYTLKEGLSETYTWINRQVAERTILNE